MRTLAALLCLAAMPAHAEPQCAPHDTVAATLERDYGETRQSLGVSHDGGLVEIWASANGTWTLTVTLPDGTTCLVAAGDQFATQAPGEPA